MGEKHQLPRTLLLVVAMAAILVLSTLRSSKMLTQTTGMKPIDSGQAAIEKSKVETSGSLKKASSGTSLPTHDDFRPVTQLKGKDACTPDPHQPLRRISGLFPNYANASRFFNISSTDNMTLPLVCEFRNDEAFFKHFAHAMQQLYGCYSYYQQEQHRHGSDQSDRAKILLLSGTMKKQLTSNPFLKGFLGVLRDQMAVEIMSRSDFLKEMGGEQSIGVARLFVPGGYVISHAEQLIEMVETYISKTTTNSTLLKATKNDHCTFPRIGILNRRPSMGRSIQNTNTIVKELVNLSFQQEIPVEYFEGKSFAEQVQFFQSVDILLSPHGAQLTGLPFLAGASSTKCEQLLELFPDNYIIPAFYGSLARNSDIGYSYHYLSDRNSPTEADDAALSANMGLRIGARAANLCVDPDIMRSSVQNLVNDWAKCCRDGSIH